MAEQLELEPQEQQTQDEPPLRAPPEPPKVVVNLDDDADDEAAAAAPEADRKTRRQQTRDFRRQLQERDREMSDLRTQLAELRGRLSVAPATQSAPATPGQDPIETELQAIEQQQQGVLAAISAPGQSAEMVEKLSATWRKMEQHRRRLEYKQFSKEDRPPASDEAAEEQFVKMTIRQEFPQVFANDALRYRAMAEDAELRRLGKPPGLATAREACQRVLGKAGLGKPPAPSPVDRARFSSVPARAGANGGGASSSYEPSRFEINLARGFTKHINGLDDAERVKIWMKATGGKMAG